MSKTSTEIEAVAQDERPAAAATYDQFVELLQGELGLSPLAVGEKFESDDIVKADNVTLWDYDWIDYTENAGTDKERNVHFAIWKTTIERNGKTIEGYYQGGVVLNKLATAIGSHGLQNELHEFGVKIKAEWGKTSGKNEILLVRVIK